MFCECTDLKSSVKRGTSYQVDDKIAVYCDICGMPRSLTDSQLDQAKVSYLPNNEIEDETPTLSKKEIQPLDHKRAAYKSAGVVSSYVVIANLLVYSVAIVGLALGIFEKVYLLIPAALLLAAFQFVWSASIRMITEYIQFKTARD